MYYILISTPKTRILDPLPSPPFFEFPLLCFIGFFISILYRSCDTRFETKRDGARVEERRGQRGEGGGSVDEQKKGAVEGEGEEGEGGGAGARFRRARDWLLELSV